MIIADNSVLVAYTKPNDIFHEAATAVIRKNFGKLFAHADTVAEYLVYPALNGLVEFHYKWLTGKAEDGNLGLRIVTAPTPPSGEPWPIHLARVRAETKLKMPDAVVLATALALGGQVATFDDGLAASCKKYGVLLN